MSGKFVGPMPVQEFLDEFLPISSGSTVGLKKTHVERLAAATTATAEKDMYPCFVSLPLFWLTILVLDYHAFLPCLWFLDWFNQAVLSDLDDREHVHFHR
jgi:hypothetical protein